MTRKSRKNLWVQDAVRCHMNQAAPIPNNVGTSRIRSIKKNAVRCLLTN